MRARNIKPSFFKNDDLGTLPYAARLLFQGLWCMADREGRLEDRPLRIKAEVLPYDDDDVDSLLNRLVERGFILRYQHGDGRFIQVINFGKHQNPHVKEAPSTIPAPDEHSASTVQEPDEHGSSPAESLILNPDTGSLNPDTTEPARAAPPSQEQPFDLFVLLCEENGVSPDSIAPSGKKKQLGIARRLLDEGFGLDKTRRCLRYLHAQDWRTGPIDLGTVLSEGPKWELNGMPAQPKSRASPNSQQAKVDAGLAAIDRWENGTPDPDSTVIDVPWRQHG